MGAATQRLEGASVAAALDEETRSLLRHAEPGDAPATLASVHRGVDSPFQFYRRGQMKAARAVGIQFRDEALGPDGAPRDLFDRVRHLDRDPTVHAVLVEHPLPAPYDFRSAIAQLRPEKDVDGVGPENLGRLLTGDPRHAPAVALAALAIARYYQVPIEGEPVTVIGRSETVGLPLALLLAARAPGPNATVTIAHSRTRNLRATLAGARTIFSCVGQPGLLTREVVPEGVAIIDVGLSSVPDPSRPSGSRAVGDADLASLDGWASAVTPVPGGVGPVTVAELMRSTARAWDMQLSIEEVP
ncbi:MAG: bifunctional 5,10-methylenetetrahydrofolate dehydrogenase/5,10-methenyltetrahydrofolate cyclohydrolase [Thermoplasmata archaeon]